MTKARGKNPLTSRTLWVNAVLIVLSIVNVLPQNKYTLAGAGVINIILRTLTTKPLLLPSLKDE